MGLFLRNLGLDSGDKDGPTTEMKSFVKKKHMAYDSTLGAGGRLASRGLLGTSNRAGPGIRAAVLVLATPTTFDE